tara:strand:- start:24 stop:335 length:312 start_codon:yes stop_codon:yes gene_type:complete
MDEGIYRHPLHSRKEEHKLLRDELEHHLTELDEGEKFEAGNTSIIYVRDLGYFVLKPKNKGYYKQSTKDVLEFGYYWIKESPEDALRQVSLENLKRAAEYYEI